MYFSRVETALNWTEFTVDLLRYGYAMLAVEVFVIAVRVIIYFQTSRLMIAEFWYWVL